MVGSGGARRRWRRARTIQKVDAEAVRDMTPRAQIQKDAAEVVKDGKPKRHMQKVAEEASI